MCVCVTVTSQCVQMQEDELRAKKTSELTEQNSQLKSTCHPQQKHQTVEKGRPAQTADQPSMSPAFVSSPAYQSLMSSLRLDAGTGQVRALEPPLSVYFVNNNNNNNNNHDDIYSAVIMTRSLREFTRFIW